METKTEKTEMVVIGGSAGSLQVILETLKKLSRHLGFPVVFVLHRKPQAVSLLPHLLQQFAGTEVIEIEDKTDLRKNKIYLVPPDYHLLFENKTIVSLDSSEKMNYSRPSIDVTFSSASRIFGKNLVAILLSGASSDGVEGLDYIKKNGGKVWIQDPDTAEVSYMPTQAMQNVEYDLLVSPDNLAEHINHLKIT
ncbi:chemotaxis protein CheB [Chryseobacterium sp. SC28]|uniref:chemotaxis protein CheB n=1 Tax=Chryseobacterium sp. SC28 TaxID=2268028 RepID=UPI000F654354|nr:chemotaxis protein CheB [Chryseobacterium sp. SC28]RRQ45239.1 chemotaxis protein CheB [Chryseobacterium sp. SC28]